MVVTSNGKGWWRLPALSGVLVGLSYFPAPLLPLNLAGFLPLLLWLDRRPRATPYEQLRAGLLFGTLTHLVTLHFMYSMLEHSWLAALLYPAFALALGVRISLSILLMGWLRRRLASSWGLLLPLCWLPLEWLQTWGDLRMTGEHLSHTVAGYPFLIQFADLVGPYGIGAVLLLFNGLLFEAIRFRGNPAGRRASIALALLIVAVLGYDGWAWYRTPVDEGTLRVGLVQPNVSLADKHDSSKIGDQWTRLTRMTLDAASSGPDVIVWPESARPIPLYHDLDRPETYAMGEVQSLAQHAGTALLVGSEYLRYRRDGERESFNAAFAVDADGRLLPEWGAKIYLVPFVEATPFRSLLGPLVEGRGGEWQWLAGGFTPGPRSAVLELADVKIGVLVCYEQLFAELARDLRNAGAQVQVVITNDAWFARSLFQVYQANALRMRAIENRTAFVRVANTGISGFVDRRGRYHQQTGLFESAVEVRDVRISNRRTVYNRIGDLVAWIAVAGLGLAWVRGRRVSLG